ncbi:MAG: isopenicillin N synthase family oxygenase [Gammaproteobacteria bacterium]|nr:isopenicillin N synthase family oxygenase [Gammaproteobacteria bacterium]
MMRNKPTPTVGSQDTSRGAHRVPFFQIPVIDLAPLVSKRKSEVAQMARELDSACADTGFFYVANHGVSATVITESYTQSQKFFAQPESVKREVDFRRSSVIVRGYVPLRETHADIAAKPDLHEAFEVGLELPPDDPDYLAGVRAYGPNQWPEGLPGFRTAVYAYYEEMRVLGERLFQAFALALGLSPDFFADKIDKPTGYLRMLHYPAHDNLSDESSWGIGPHTDYECFTILSQDDAGGLQVQNSAGAWIEAPPIAGTFIVNLGDIMARWTNDRYQSTPHRVINRSGHDRYSMAHFFGANYHTIVECLPGCHDPDNPPRYPPVVAGEWALENVIAAYYGDGAPGLAPVLREPSVKHNP